MPPTPAPGSCHTCGRPLDAHDRHIRFGLPDPAFALPQREQTPGTWMSGEDANTSVMLQVPGVGAFVRAQLPVALTGGFSVTYGVWLGIHPHDLRRAFAVWWEPAYRDLVLDGRLANPLPAWGLLGRPVRAVVRDLDQAPWVVESTDADLASVLTGEWDHDLVLGTTGGT